MGVQVLKTPHSAYLRIPESDSGMGFFKISVTNSITNPRLAIGFRVRTGRYSAVNLMGLSFGSNSGHCSFSISRYNETVFI